MKKNLIILFIVLLNVCNGQEMTGVITGNYAGVNSVFINPALMIDSKVYLDINFISADVFFQNNYLYLPKEDFGFFNLFKKDYTFKKYGNKDWILEMYRNSNSKEIFSQQRINGPSIMYSSNDFAFAFYNSARVITSIENLPINLATLIYEGFEYIPQHNQRFDNNNIKVTSMAWTEFGLSFTKNLKKYNRNRWDAGLTIKRLFAFEGVYVNIDNLNYEITNDSVVDIYNLNAELGYSMPINYSNNDFPDDGKFFKGKGWGFDFGITYQKKEKGQSDHRFKKNCEKEYEDYLYKIGLSFIDIGQIKFTENAEKHIFDNVNVDWKNLDTVAVTSVHQLVQTFSDVFLNDPNASLKAYEFSIFLPSAFSLQFDYHYFKYWYFNATAIMPLKISKIGIKRPSQILFTPRYEKSNIEINVPVSLYDFKYPRLGFSIRYYFFTIGSDNLLSYFGINDFTGFDFYFAIKFNLLKGRCNRYKSSKGCENLEYSKSM
jgi:hypothetical protein